MSLLKHVGALYDALDDSSFLIGFLSSIEADLGGSNVALGYIDNTSGHPAYQASNLPDDGIQDYLANAAEDPWLMAAQSRTALPPVILGSDLVSPKELRATRFYRNILQPYDCVYALTISKLAPHYSIYLAINRSQRLGDFDVTEKLELASLVHHVHRYGELLQSSRTISQLRKMDFPCYKVDEQSILWMNEQGSDLLSRTSALTTKSGTLTLRDPRANRRLQTALTHIATRDWYLADLGPIFFHGDSGFGFLLILPNTKIQSDFSRRYYANIIVIVPTPERLKDTFKNFELSPSEAGLAEAITFGKTIQQYANENGKSIHTVRKQLKQIFSKTNVSSQSALVRLMLTGAKTLF